MKKLNYKKICSNDSGKHNGESHISYRGRKRLRYVLYEAAISLIEKNAEFKKIPILFHGIVLKDLKMLMKNSIKR